MSAAASTSAGAAAPADANATERARAAAAVEAARLDAPRGDLRVALEELFAEGDADVEEEIHRGARPEAALALARGREAASEAAFSARVRALLVNPAALGEALEEILAAEAEAERIEALYRALRERAARRAARTRALLWPFVEAWTEAHPPKKGTKSWTFPSTSARVTMRKHDGRLVVKDEAELADALRRALGSAAAVETGALRVRVEVAPSHARKACEAAGVDPATLSGACWEPAGERLTLYRA